MLQKTWRSQAKSLAEMRICLLTVLALLCQKFLNFGSSRWTLVSVLFLYLISLSVITYLDGIINATHVTWFHINSFYRSSVEDIDRGFHPRNVLLLLAIVAVHGNEGGHVLVDAAFLHDVILERFLQVLREFREFRTLSREMHRSLEEIRHEVQGK